MSISSPLASAFVMAFGVTVDAARCRAFYEGKLGLRVVSDDPMAITFASGPSVIRIQKFKEFAPKPYTVLGWTVSDIRTTVAQLTAAGIALEHFGFMPMRDSTGIATFDTGDQVAWFKDPDGNMLGVTQFAKG